VADAERLNVATQARETDSTLNFVRRLLALRAARPALQSGRQRSLDVASELFCFLREDDECLLIALNFTSERVPLGLGGKTIIELSTDPRRELGEVGLDALVLEPDEGLVMNLPSGSPWH
jgi:alpha-glucosidase